MQKRPDFPLVWDNTMRSAFVECPQKAFWEFFEHYKPLGESIHLHAGKAWAHGLEITRRAFYAMGRSPEQAQAQGLEAMIHAYGDFQPPERGSGAAKSLDRLIEAFTYYFKAFPLETDPVQPYMGKTGPMIEFSFAHPLADDLLHPETGEPIIYAGRADMVATFAGSVSIYDDKTTSALGASWANQWNIRSQFTGYAWAAHKAGIPVSQIVVRGIAILKTQINHAQAITVRTPGQIARWHEQAVRDIRRAIAAWKEGYYDRNLAEACSAYGGCMFQQVCMTDNPEPWLEGSFKKRIWNPVTREEDEFIPIVVEKS